MQQALEQASAAIDQAVAQYAGELGTMRQETAAEQAALAAMEQEIVARRTKIAGMQATLAQHEAHYNAVAAMRAGAAASAPQPVPVSAIGDAPASAGGPRPGSAPVASAQPDGLAAAVARVMQGAPPPVPYPSAPASAS